MADKYGKGWDNLDDAAGAALYLLAQQPRAHEQEYMGLLFQDPKDGKYYRTGFQTQGRREQSSWTGSPEGRIAGVVHNHPQRKTGDVYPPNHFSDTDVKSADTYGENSYIVAAEPNKPVPDQRLYAPGRTRTYRPGSLRDPSGLRHSLGEEFLSEFPMDEAKTAMVERIRSSRLPEDVKRQLLEHLMRKAPTVSEAFEEVVRR
jgi:proteasome lid subunit RPN8/RPN11